jgi:murein DD-endopeptidase MepM/ murein hydrolase activator NlpD
MRHTLPAVALSAAALGAVPGAAVARKDADPCPADPQAVSPDPAVPEKCVCPPTPGAPGDPTATPPPAGADPSAEPLPQPMGPAPAPGKHPDPGAPACGEPDSPQPERPKPDPAPLGPKPDAYPLHRPRHAHPPAHKKKPRHKARRAPSRSKRVPNAPRPRVDTTHALAPTRRPRPLPVPKAVRRLRVPLFLLPIYRAAEARYGVPWSLLAAINEIESDFGRNPRVSTAGALGWMQFMPPTWQLYGEDANLDGHRDPYNPVDAIFAAARYLSASGAGGDVRTALFAYNHADWYVDDVLARARRIERAGAPLIDVLTSLAYARLPVTASASWRMVGRGARRAVTIYAPPGSDVVAVSDGVIVGLGRSTRLGRYVVLRDLAGNLFTYARLGRLAAHHLVASSAGASGTGQGKTTKVRLFAHPARPAARAAGGLEQLLEAGVPVPGYSTFWGGPAGVLPGQGPKLRQRPLRVGARVAGGTLLGSVGGAGRSGAGRIHFEIRPAGRQSPRIDPRPLLEAWRLLAAAGAFRPSGTTALDGMQAQLAIRQGVSVPLPLLERRVLHDPRIAIYPCGRADISAGRIDRRVLVTLEFLAEASLDPTVTSLECAHSYYTSSGNVSEHSSGDAVDIAAINGVPILGHQGSDSIADVTIRRLLTLSGAMKPHQIISLMTYDGTDNTLSLPDHADHIHVGFRPRRKPGAPTRGTPLPTFTRRDWMELGSRLSAIPSPRVPVSRRLRPRPAARAR